MCVGCLNLQGSHLLRSHISIMPSARSRPWSASVCLRPSLGEPTHHNLLESDPAYRNAPMTLTKCGHGPSWTTLVAGIREYEITC